jgi:crotonobetainyl-CoA:carnitine CoA-transferase CaiB-like acyl-CoA transferase
MARAGLGYDDLKKVNPNVIMLSASIYGESGPFSQVRGFGSTLTALTGFPHLTGFPDEPPQLPSAAFTDYISPRIMVLAIMVALDHRRATGEGQYIDSAQLEAAVPLLTPVLLDCGVNRREPGRTGNKSPYMAPHGVYPCKGDDRWCTISVSSDEEWAQFCAVIGNPLWTKDPTFGNTLGRVKNSEVLDTFVANGLSGILLKPSCI